MTMLLRIKTLCTPMLLKVIVERYSVEQYQSVTPTEEFNPVSVAETILCRS